MSLIGSIVTFVVGLLVGGLGLYVGGTVIAGGDDYGHALWTALWGALGWGIISLLVGWIPFLGGPLALVLGLLVYLAVVNWRYRGGWAAAAGIAAIAWGASVIVLALLSIVLPWSLDVVGVPFV